MINTLLCNPERTRATESGAHVVRADTSRGNGAHISTACTTRPAFKVGRLEAESEEHKNGMRRRNLKNPHFEQFSGSGQYNFLN